MSGDRRDPDVERRKLFRRMEWVFVYAPPLIIALIGVFGGLFLAVFVPIPGTNLWGRWALAVLVVIIVPALAYIARSWWGRRGSSPPR